MKLIDKIISLVVVSFFSITSLACANGPSWKDIPSHLKQGTGMVHQGDWLVATGSAKVQVIGGRTDKANELAKKKSFSRALQVLYVSGACAELMANLSPADQDLFIEDIGSDEMSANVQDISVIRQWKDADVQFTTVSAPASKLDSFQCKYSSVQSAIVDYVNSGPVSLPGLEFGMRHVDRHSVLYKTLRDKAGEIINSGDPSVFSFLFSRPSLKFENGQAGPVLFQQAFHLSEQLNQDASKLAKDGQWPKALQATAESLKLSPNFPKPYLLLAEYLLAQKQPALALLAAEKAMLSGITQQEALERLVAAQRDSGSEEVEVFQYLLKNVSDKGLFSAPSFWQEELEHYRSAGAMVAHAVVASSGQAFAGESLSPDSEFDTARQLYGKAKGDDDLLKVLSHLISAAQKQPLSADTYNLIGACYRNLGKPELALPFLWQALKLKPGYDFALTNLGLCCQKLGLNKAAGYYFKHDAVKNSTNGWVRASYEKFFAGKS